MTATTKVRTGALALRAMDFLTPYIKSALSTADNPAKDELVRDLESKTVEELNTLGNELDALITSTEVLLSAISLLHLAKSVEQRDAAGATPSTGGNVS